MGMTKMTAPEPGGTKTGAHPAKALSAAFVRNATGPGRYSDGNGLALIVAHSGAKRWEQRLVVRGKRCDIGLGSASLVTLAEAREKALANRRLARSGGDPLAEKHKADAVPTFRVMAERYLATKAQEFRNEKHRAQWRSTLDAYAMPVLGSMRVSDITMRDVLRVLEPIWQSRTETASRLRGRIEAILSRATVEGHRSGDNPARWSGNLKELLPAPGKISKEGNHPAVSPDDASRWFASLRRREGFGARALEFVALTAARSGEVRGMTWAEVDLGKALWTIPAARMKAGKEHRIPLSASAVALLKSLPRLDGNSLVFPAPRGGQLSDMTLSATMKRIHEAAVAEGDGDQAAGFLDARNKRPAVPHGLRSTFRDWVAERTHFPGDMAEVALAHKVANAVEASYRRGDMVEKRRAMMAAWASFLGGERVEKVVRLRG